MEEEAGIAATEDAVGWAIGRRAVLGTLGAAMLAREARGQGRQLYEFDESGGILRFTARHYGLLSSTGRFARFKARVEIDAARAENASVEVEVETGSAELGYAGAVELLRSAAYFDSARFPTATFRGAANGAGNAARFAIEGVLTVKGIARPMRMEARLVGRERVEGREVARFEAEGSMLRSEYGMVADPFTVSDRIGLGVQVRLAI